MNTSLNEVDKHILKKISLSIKKRFFNDKNNNDSNNISIETPARGVKYSSFKDTQIKEKVYNKLNNTNYFGQFSE